MLSVLIVNDPKMCPLSRSLVQVQVSGICPSNGGITVVHSRSVCPTRDNGAMMTSSAEHAGDPKHPDHEAYLVELGRATYAAAGLSKIAFDVLRIHSGIVSKELYDDPLGRLERRLKNNPPPLSGLEDFLSLLGLARLMRNDLIHALPVKHGLYRRTTKDTRHVREFYSVESLREARSLFERARHKGNKVLYSDGGEAINRWYEKGEH